MLVNLNNDWSEHLNEEMQKPYFIQLLTLLEQEYDQYVVYPPQEHLMSAFEWTSYAQTKVVIVGQDPYHGPGQAHGLSFSVLPGVKLPPSLLNMLKEAASDVGTEIPNHGYLASWAEQGVLMLNTVLTVREGEANSHKGLGWEHFTDRVIQLLNEREQPIVFVLWGSHAQSKAKMVDVSKHRILMSPHPSPLSAYRGFFGSKPYSQINEQLIQWGSEPIDWQLPQQSE